MQINGREISSNQPPYMVAEISCNHGGDLGLALKLIEEAKKAGADAVKFQCYTPEEITLNSDKPDFIIKDGPWKGRKLYDLYEAAYTPREWFGWLFEQGKRFGITVFSSVFSKEGVDFLETFNCPAYKIASMEIADTELIKYTVATGKPIIISTGMASGIELANAMGFLRAGNCMLLHCVSGYPTPIEEAHLKSIGPFWKGISDHTIGWTIPVAATALGATIIEKHFWLLDPTKPWEEQTVTEDRDFSLDQYEFKDMVVRCRQVWQAMQPSKPKSEESSRQLRRSLYIVQDIKKGEKFTDQNVRSIRPSYGLPPREIRGILGKYASKDIEAGTALTWEMVNGHSSESATRDFCSEPV